MTLTPIQRHDPKRKDEMERAAMEAWGAIFNPPLKVNSAPSVSDADFHGWWKEHTKAGKVRHASSPLTGQCSVCGMTDEEILDYSEIECAAAQRAHLPRDPVRLGSDHVLAEQRSLILEGLLSRARRLQRMKERITLSATT